MPEGNNRRVGVEVFASAAEANRELSAFKQTVSETGAAASSANQRAAVAADGLSSSSRAAAASLGATSAAAGAVRVNMAQLERFYENVVRTQGANSVAAQTLAKELGIQSQAATQAAAAINEKSAADQKAAIAEEEAAAAAKARAAAAAEEAAFLAALAGEQKTAEVATQSFSLSTSDTAKSMRIMGAESRLLGGGVQGLVRPLSLLVNGFGAFGGVQFLVIAGMGILISLLGRLFAGKSENLKLDSDSLAIEQLKIDLLHQEATVNGGV